MEDILTKDNFLKKLNNDIPSEEYYTSSEIRDAFERRDYSTDNEKTRRIYDIFFMNYTSKARNSLCKSFEISKISVRKIYFKSPYRKIKKIARSWEGLYREKVEVRPYTRIDQKDKEKAKLFKQRKEYEELYKFETYELTPCIAYEMAFRNTKVKKLLERHQLISEMIGSYKYIGNILMSKNLFAFTYNLKDEKEIEEEYPKYQKLFQKKQATYKRLIKDDYKKFIDEHLQNCTEMTNRTLLELHEMIENELINNYLIYPTGYHRDVPGADRSYPEEITNSKKKKSKNIIDEKTDNGAWQIRFEEIIHNEFIQVQEVHINRNKYRINNIIPNFHRQVNDQEQTKISINFSLPLEEIVEYITKVKKKINIKSPLELLGEKLSIGTDLTNMTAKDAEGNEIKSNMTRGEKPQYRLIDMLYIYDMTKQGFDDKDISQSIEEYYTNELKISSKLKDKSIRENVLLTAIEYIEEERYKELITGKAATK